MDNSCASPSPASMESTSDSVWVRVADTSDIVVGEPFGVRLDVGAVVLLRTTAGLRAFQGDCPHAGGPLHRGKLVGGRLVCPKHGWSFDAETGRRGNVCLRALEVDERDGDVWVREPRGAITADSDFPAGQYARGASERR